MTQELSHVGMVLCFWCGEPDRILLDRRLKKSLPHSAVYDYEPCPACRGKMDSGFTIIEATERATHDNQRSLDRAGSQYPTGTWWVLKHEAAERIFSPEIVAARRACIMPEIARKIGLQKQNQG